MILSHQLTVQKAKFFTGNMLKSSRILSKIESLKNQICKKMDVSPSNLWGFFYRVGSTFLGRLRHSQRGCHEVFHTTVDKTELAHFHLGFSFLEKEDNYIYTP